MPPLIPIPIPTPRAVAEQAKATAFIRGRLHVYVLVVTWEFHDRMHHTNKLRDTMNPKLFMFALLLASSSIGAKQPEEEPEPSRVFEWATAKLGDFERWLLINERVLGQCDACRLLVSWTVGAASTANFNIAEFLVQPNDDRDTRLLIKHRESGLDLRVGVSYQPSYLENNPLVIRMELAFEGDADVAFWNLTRTQAETIREKNWKYLSLTKEIDIGNKVYSFIFHCENGKSYQKQFRRILKQ